MSGQIQTMMSHCQVSLLQITMVINKIWTKLFPTSNGMCEIFSLPHLLIVCFRQGPNLSKVVPVI
jgi:Flp pilus assembly CpaE family ATPase